MFYVKEGIFQLLKLIRYECLIFTQILCFPGIFIKVFALYVCNILIKQKESEDPKFHFPMGQRKVRNC